MQRLLVSDHRIGLHIYEIEGERESETESEVLFNKNMCYSNQYLIMIFYIISTVTNTFRS